MAANLKSTVYTGVGTTKEAVFTGGAGVSTTLIGFNVANITVDTVAIDVYLYKSSTTTEATMVKESYIPAGSSLLVISEGQKIVLEENDEIRIVSDTATSIDVIASYLEK